MHCVFVIYVFIVIFYVARADDNFDRMARQMLRQPNTNYI